MTAVKIFLYITIIFRTQSESADDLLTHLVSLIEQKVLPELAELKKLVQGGNAETQEEIQEEKEMIIGESEFSIKF